MTVVCWLVAALAGEMPADIDLNDLDGYRARAERVLKGPVGCWEVRGYAIWASWENGGQMADSEGPFRARLVNGRWERAPASAYRPLIGRSYGQERVALALSEWLETLTGDAETEYLRWDADRDVVTLRRDAGLEGGRTAVTKTRFYEDGPAVDVVFPKHRLAGDLKLIGAGYEVRTVHKQGVVLPASESLAFRVRSGGRVARGHQSIRYAHWEPCSAR